MNNQRSPSDVLPALFRDGHRCLRIACQFALRNGRRFPGTILRSRSVRTKCVDGSHPATEAIRKRLRRHPASGLLHFAGFRLPSKNLPHPLHLGKEVLISECQVSAAVGVPVGKTDKVYRVSPAANVLLKRPYRVAAAEGAIFCVREGLTAAFRCRRAQLRQERFGGELSSLPRCWSPPRSHPPRDNPWGPANVQHFLKELHPIGAVQALFQGCPTVATASLAVELLSEVLATRACRRFASV